MTVKPTEHVDIEAFINLLDRYDEMAEDKGVELDNAAKSLHDAIGVKSTKLLLVLLSRPDILQQIVSNVN